MLNLINYALNDATPTQVSGFRATVNFLLNVASIYDYISKHGTKSMKKKLGTITLVDLMCMNTQDIRNFLATLFRTAVKDLLVTGLDAQNITVRRSSTDVSIKFTSDKLDKIKLIHSLKGELLANFPLEYYQQHTSDDVLYQLPMSITSNQLSFRKATWFKTFYYHISECKYWIKIPFLFTKAMHEPISMYNFSSIESSIDANMSVYKITGCYCKLIEMINTLGESTVAQLDATAEKLSLAIKSSPNIDYRNRKPIKMRSRASTAVSPTNSTTNA